MRKIKKRYVNCILPVLLEEEGEKGVDIIQPKDARLQIEMLSQ